MAKVVCPRIVREDVTVGFDPRDMGEVRVFYEDRFLCPAVSAELARETIPLRDIIRVRNQRRRELSSVLQDRQKVVDALLQSKRGAAPKEIHSNAAVLPVSGARIKRHRKTDKPTIVLADDNVGMLEVLAKLLRPCFRIGRRLMTVHSSTKIVFLTLESNKEFIDEARCCGHGYVFKMRVYSDLLPALEAALRGEFFTSDFAKLRRRCD
jgi:DNA-binding NarL/FixJ family response regulator